MEPNNRSEPKPGQDHWLQFLEDCDLCRDCGLGQSRQNVVVYRGAIRAPLMIIGEGPGAEEDLQGKPFVGAAGRLLDLLLTALGFTNDSYHIGNIVKCRPPENRAPTEDEAKACRPLLARQFRFVKPAYIVLLGATAYKYFTGQNEGITKIRGQWIEKNGYHILPTFHPAYILRNNRERVKLFEDLALVRAAMEADGLIAPLTEPPSMPEGRR
jgi:uracil-DNA glycosylase family 4